MLVKLSIYLPMLHRYIYISPKWKLRNNNDVIYYFMRRCE